jgi:hypothetical protein
MKKRILAVTLVFVLGIAGILSAYDDDYVSESRKKDWRADALEKTLSIGVGFWRAVWSQVTYDNGFVAQYKYSDPDWLFSLGAKLFFYQSNFGIGVDAILMDSTKQDFPAYSETNPITGVTNNFAAGTTTITQWLVDVDLYYRFPLIPSLNLVAGAGLTLNYVNTGDHPYLSDKASGAGWNAKLGAEFFVDDSISLSLYWTLHNFNRGTTVAGSQNMNATVTLTSLLFMANLYI